MEANVLQYAEAALLLYLLQSRSVPTEGGQSTILQAHMDLLNIVYGYVNGPGIG